MNRERGSKTLDCAACGKPTRAGAEAARVLCDACAAAGREFPRARQLELFPPADPGGGKIANAGGGAI
jgi:hypothetical protein